MADLPFDLGDGLAARLALAFDREEKIVRALEALGPIAGRDLLVVDPAGGMRRAQLAERGARIVEAVPGGLTAHAPASADVIVGFWSAFRAPGEDEFAEAERVLRLDGRLLVVHDYGRDDVSRLAGDRPEYGSWSRRDGWFLRSGFRIRVIHCFWTFESIDEARDFLEAAFGEVGATVADSLRRPRLSYNVAIYHRTRGEHPAAATEGASDRPRRPAAVG